MHYSKKTPILSLKLIPLLLLVCNAEFLFKAIQIAGPGPFSKTKTGAKCCF